MENKRVWEKRIMELTPAEYEQLQQKAKEFDLLADWLLNNLSHQIGVTDMESAREMVQRILTPFVEPTLMGYVTFLATDEDEGPEANVVCDGRLWNMNGVATHGKTIDHALDRLKEVFALYDIEVAAKWGTRVIVETSEYERLQECMAEEIESLREFLQTDDNVVRVVAGTRGYVVYLKNLTVERKFARVLGMTHWHGVSVSYERADE